MQDTYASIRLKPNDFDEFLRSIGFEFHSILKKAEEVKKKSKPIFVYIKP